MEITVYGGGKEVGRSCFEVDSNNRRFIFDAGVKIHHDSLDFPESIPNLGYVQNVFISHIHLDHSGALPLLYAKGLRCPIYASTTTKNLLPILLKDSWKVSMIEKRVVGYKKSDIKKLLNLVIEFPEATKRDTFSKFDVAGAKVQVFDAGHVPGSRYVHLDFGNESFAYTGDISLTNMRLVPSAAIEKFPKVDVLMIESTYGSHDHPDRKLEEKRFFHFLDETLARGGSVLIPTFAVGRSQEVLMLLEGAGYMDKYSVYFEGMCKRVTLAYLNDLDHAKLARAFNKARIIEGHEERDAVLNKQSIIITTSGMLDGGPVLNYLKKVTSNDAILLTGYQADETNGRSLLERRVVDVDGKNIKIKSVVEKFDFSSHAGSTDLKKIIAKVKPKHVILVHGEGKNLDDLAKYVESIGAKAHIPKVGARINIAKAL